MYIESLEVRQFRCFAHEKVHFQYLGKQKPGKTGKAGLLSPNINLILGDNGTGKSAILQGLTLGVLGRIMAGTGFRPYYMVRRSPLGTEQADQGSADIRARIVLHDQDGEASSDQWRDEPTGSLTGQAVITRRGDIEIMGSTALVNPGKWQPLFKDDSPAFFIAAYGPSRRAEKLDTFDTGLRERSRAPRYQRIANIFEDASTLTPISVWLNELLRRERLEEGLTILNGLLPSNVHAIDSLEDSESLFRVNGTLLPFSVLSDGYRAFIAWVVDLIHQINVVTTQNHGLAEMRGVVIVDELDLLLHPTWQRTVIEALASAFPNLQLFLTTHSPIIAGSLDAANIIMTVVDAETGMPSIKKFHEQIHGLSADQVLGSAYFGLATSRAPAAELRLRELAERAWNNEPNAASEYLRGLAKGFKSE